MPSATLFRAPRSLLSVSAFLFALGCGSDPTLAGTVHDCFGAPVAGATVTLEGVTEHVSTDAQGAFSLPAAFTGKRQIQAGKEGYILSREAAFINEGAETIDPVKLLLFPDPGKPGFHLVNLTAYSELPEEAIDTVGTELHAYTGVKDHGQVSVSAAEKLRFIFSTTRSRAQIARLGLELHKLEFVENTTVAGVLGEETVKVNRFVATERQEFDLKELPSEDDWLIGTRNKLEPSIYAFHTEGLMTSKHVDVADKTPPELRVAYTFEVK